MKDREFVSRNKDDVEVSLVYKRPSQEILKKAELVFQKKFSDAVRNGILLQAEIQKMVKERGLYTQEDEAKELEMRKELVELEKKLVDEANPLPNDEGQKVCATITMLRERIRDHTNILLTMLQNTCESIAMDERSEYLVVECTYYKDGARVYKDIGDYRTRSGELMAMDIFRQALIANTETNLGRELSNDLTDELPEKKWLAKLAT